MTPTLETIRHLEPNWNGYGALPISPDVIDRAAVFLDTVATPLMIVPTNDGGVQFEWEVPGVKYLEVECLPDGFGYLLEIPGQAVEQDGVTEVEVREVIERYTEVLG